MQDDPFDEVPGAFVPMHIALAAEHERIADERRVFDKRVAIGFEDGERVVVSAVISRLAFRDAERVQHVHCLSQSFGAPAGCYARGLGLRVNHQSRALVPGNQIRDYRRYALARTAAGQGYDVAVIRRAGIVRHADEPVPDLTEQNFTGAVFPIRIGGDRFRVRPLRRGRLMIPRSGDDPARKIVQ